MIATTVQVAEITLPRMSTLSERVIEAIGTPPRFTVAEIAEACDMSVQAVYKWRRGDTLKFKGSTLVELAALTGYEARWLKRILAGTTGASVDNVEAIANALGVSITTLVRKS